MSAELELHKQVAAEVADSKFVSHIHGRPGTYNAGCRGPLCRKANRDRRREQYMRMAWRAQGGPPTEYQPRPERALDAFLSVLQAQHEREQLEIRTAAS